MPGGTNEPPPTSEAPDGPPPAFPDVGSPQPADPPVPAAAPPPVRWQVPPAVVPVPNAPGLVFADVPARMIAYLLDVAIVAMAGAVILIALGLGEQVQTRTSSYVWVSGWTANLAFALLGAAYFGFFW